MVGGSIFQQLYNFIDTLIIGRLLGIDALVAIGAYYPLSFLILGFVQGSCVGFSILLAQSVDEDNKDDIQGNIIGGCMICLILMVFLTPIMIGLANSILVGLNTPQDILKLATGFTMIGVNSFARKVAQAIAGGFGGFMLTFIGYKSSTTGGGTQTTSVIDSIYHLATGIPTVCLLVAALLLLFFYPLSKKRVHENAETLAKIHAENTEEEQEEETAN
ncbi:MATE family efflux transporter [Lentilactobacillus hilgardii]|uniref:MATE family efflux transporter n=1 Tax=Lentilactobacillus hilgardii TaxID=1588 RepID=UPI0035D02493